MWQNTLDKGVFQQFPTLHFAWFQPQRVRSRHHLASSGLFSWCVCVHRQNDFPQSRGDWKMTSCSLSS